MRKTAYRATMVAHTDIYTSLVSGLPRRSAKTAFDYEREDDHAAWVEQNNAALAAEEHARRGELEKRTHAYQESLAAYWAF